MVFPKPLSFIHPPGLKVAVAQHAGYYIIEGWSAFSPLFSKLVFLDGFIAFWGKPTGKRGATRSLAGTLAIPKTSMFSGLEPASLPVPPRPAG